MKNIKVDRLTANFIVQTSHGSNLQEVLEDSADREDVDNSYYADKLWDMLSAGVDKSTGTASVCELETFDDLQFIVEAYSEKDLKGALEKCNVIVGDWLKEFHIDAKLSDEDLAIKERDLRTIKSLKKVKKALKP